MTWEEHRLAVQTLEGAPIILQRHKENCYLYEVKFKDLDEWLLRESAA